MTELAWTQGERSAYERNGSIVDVFGAVAALDPSALAVVDEGRVVSYEDLERASNQFAHYLRSRGVLSGSRVGVAMERSIDVPCVLLGILKAGASYVPLEASQPVDRLSYIIEDVGIACVVVETLSDGDAFRGVAIVSVREDAGAIASCSATRPDVLVAADSLAYVMYTSGSTGTPKGVEIVHRGVLRLVRGADYISIARDDVFFQFAPLAFDASTFEIWGALLNGATLAVPVKGALSFAEVGTALRRFGVTVLWLTAPLFSLMVRTELPLFESLRCLLTGGDIVSPGDAAAFIRTNPHCSLVDGYGPTENTTFSCCYRIDSLDAIGESVPIGKPIANATAYILDESLLPVAPGIPGELFVGGDGVARGYVNLPELTAERFLIDPFSSEVGARMYRTGDRARLRADNLIEFLGRSDDQVKINGFRIELAEIERALRANSLVREGAVSVVSDDSGRKFLAAHVVTAPGSMLNVRAVRDHLGSILPQHMVPHRILFVEVLPKNSSGKIDRTELTRRASGVRDPVVPKFRKMQTQLEATISACWVEVLGNGVDADPNTNFFDAGGDSLRLLALHERLVRVLGIDIELLDLFAYPTVRSLVQALDARKVS